jgi:hypothetical protein
VTVINSNHETVRHQSDTTGGAKYDRKLPNLLPWLLIAVTALIVFFRPLGNAPLLDEQYILAWLQALAKGAEEPVQREFLIWPGLNPTDFNGVITGIYLRVAYFFAGGQLFLLKFYNLVVHVIAASCVALITLRMSGRTLPSVVAALLFLVSPLSWQAVSWLGATGTLLSTALILPSLNCYVAGRNRGFRWSLLGASAVLYLMALLASSNAWTAALAVMLCELLALPALATAAGTSGETTKSRWSSSDLSFAIMTPLIFIVVTAAYFAGTGLPQTMVAAGMAPEPSPTNLFAGLKKVLLPVNEQLFTNVGKQYFYLTLFTAPAFLGLAAALWLRKVSWLTVGFCLLWLLLSLLPSLGHLPGNKTLIGDAAFYPALAPLAVLLALGFCGLGMIVQSFLKERSERQPRLHSINWSRLNAALVLLPVTLLAFTYIRLLWKEQDFLRSTGKTVAKLQEQGKQLAARSAAPYVVLTTMPPLVSLSPLYSSTGVSVFEAATMLMSSPTVPAGRLKDALRNQEFVTNSGRWQPAMRQIVELDLHFNKNLWGSSRNAVVLGDTAIPNIIHNPLAAYDAAQSAIVLKSRAPAGPILTLDGLGLSPLEGDFLYMDAKLEGVAPGAPATIEFYWQTREMDFYDSNLRKVTLKAEGGARDFIRYYLPLRTIGWTTNGPLMKLTVGFPAGSTAYIKEMGVGGNQGLMPALNFIAPAAKFPEQTHFANGYYKFPTNNTLGLCALPYQQSRLTLTYDTTQVESASGVTFEVSLPNRPFEQPNSSRLSGVTWGRFPVEGRRGTFELNLDDLQPGLIYVRAIAMDKQHGFIGFFSDDICINLSR